MPETMLETIANIVTILGLGAGIVYSVYKFSQATWQRIRHQATFPRILTILLLLCVIVGLVISAQELANLSDDARKTEIKIATLESYFTESNLKKYSWWQGNPRTQLIPANQGICFLTRVGGQFEGAGEEVYIDVNENGYWYLYGQ